MPNQAASGGAPVSVRVVQSGEPGTRARGSVLWEAGDGQRPVEVELQAGESRVVQVPNRGDRPGVLLLAGDAHPFDNRLAIAASTAQPVEILYLGDDDGRDPKAPRYFLERALPSTRSRAPKITAFAAHRPGEGELATALARAHLVVVTAVPPPETARLLRTHLERGRTLLLAPTGPVGADVLAPLLPSGAGSFELRQAGAQEGVLTDIDLGHPVLAPFADGALSDFTRIRFWKRRLLDALRAAAAARVVARFDDGAPPGSPWPVGRGLLSIMTSGWAPADSQLALSSKLVPLLWSLLETSAGLASGHRRSSSSGSPWRCRRRRAAAMAASASRMAAGCRWRPAPGRSRRPASPACTRWSALVSRRRLRSR